MLTNLTQFRMIHVWNKILDCVLAEILAKCLDPVAKFCKMFNASVIKTYTRRVSYFFYLFILFIYYFWGGNFPFSHTIQTLQFIYTTRHYTHYIGIFRSRYIYIYLCNEIIPISQVITTHFWNNRNQVRSKAKDQKAK